MSARKGFATYLLVPVALSLVLASCGGTQTKETKADECPFRLPWSNALGEIRISQGYAEPDNRSHKFGSDMEYAIDFALPEGTPVLATRDGIVSKVHDGETAFGGPEAKNNANFVIIGHGDGTFSLYTHLQRTVFTKADEGTRRVQQGEVIGYSGKTGWTNGRPHLHYQLQERGDRFGQSIPLCFEEVEGGVPLLNKKYASQNQMVMVQGMQVTRAPEVAPSSDPFIGTWRGEVKGKLDYGSGGFYTDTKTFVITPEGCGAELCLLVPSHTPNLTYPASRISQDEVCFEMGIGQDCFSPLSDELLAYHNFGPFGEEGILERVGDGEIGSFPPDPALPDMTDPESVFLWVKYSLEQKDFSMLGEVFPNRVCLSSASVGCKYLPEIPREEALAELRAHMQDTLTCIGYETSEYPGGFRYLHVSTLGWNPGWETGEEDKDPNKLTFTFSNSWSSVTGSSGTEIATSVELRLVDISPGLAPEAGCR